MAPEYHAPGVFVEEVSFRPASIQGVSTTQAVFIGSAQRASDSHGNDCYGKPVKVHSVAEFERVYGGPDLQTEMLRHNAAIQVVENGGSVVVSVKPAWEKSTGRYLYFAVKQFFLNGGRTCWVIASGNFADPVNDAILMPGLEQVNTIAEANLILFTDRHSDLADTEHGYKNLYQRALDICAETHNAMLIMEPWIYTGNPESDAADFRNQVGLVNRKFGCVYYPWLKLTETLPIDETLISVGHTVEGQTGILDGMELSRIKQENNATYMLIRQRLEEQGILVPPGPSVAGIMVRTDMDRGVWKAPANAVVKGVYGPDVIISDRQQENLNVHASGISINAIRRFDGKGTLVWGARTLAGNDNEWRYIPVRRFFNFVETSLTRGTEFVVFEPNDAKTWSRVKGVVDNFLNHLWREGALLGAKPEEGYFVRVGLHSTMTQRDIDEGRMVIEVGLAAARPAEFISFRIIQYTSK